MRVRAVGADALLLEVDDPAAWFAELDPPARPRRAERGRDRARCQDRTARRLGRPAGRDRIRPVVEAHAAGTAARPAAVVEIPVSFTGPDLPAVAELWGVTPTEVVDRLVRTAVACRVLRLHARLGLPRRPAGGARGATPETPRPRVPAGSVGLADRYAGIYPTASPGGWRLVGRTDVTLFEPGAHRRRRCSLPARGYASLHPLWTHDDRGRQAGPAHDGPGPGPARIRAPGRGPVGRTRPAGTHPREHAGRQPRHRGGPGDHAHRRDACAPRRTSRSPSPAPAHRSLWTVRRSTSTPLSRYPPAR